MPAYDDSNVFARILRGEIPAEKIYEDDDAIAIMDLMPQTDGHCLVIPKAPSRNLLDASDETLAKLMPVAAKLARAVVKAFDADGVVISQFNESVAGQTVFHLHVHVVPFYEGVKPAPHGERKSTPEILARHAEKIRAALA